MTADTGTKGPAMTDLHAAIMNLEPRESYEAAAESYRLGFRDARHAAAELVSAALSAPDALTAQAAEIDALKIELDNADGMAGCMAMFRRDMIEAGVITESVAPMFMTEAILSKLSALRADAERLTNERAVYGRWMYEAMLTLHTLVDEDSEDGGESLRMLIDRGERLADAAMQSGKAVTP